MELNMTHHFIVLLWYIFFVVIGSCCVSVIIILIYLTFQHFDTVSYKNSFSFGL